MSELSQLARQAIPRLERLILLEEVSVPEAGRLLKKSPEFIRSNFPIIVHSTRSHHVRLADIEAFQAKRTLRLRKNGTDDRM
jgi:hypothetical protein